jgi:hypothetical protein
MARRTQLPTPPYSPAPLKHVRPPAAPAKGTIFVMSSSLAGGLATLASDKDSCLFLPVRTIAVGLPCATPKCADKGCEHCVGGICASTGGVSGCGTCVAVQRELSTARSTPEVYKSGSIDKERAKRSYSNLLFKAPELSRKRVYTPQASAPGTPVKLSAFPTAAWRAAPFVLPPP